MKATAPSAPAAGTRQRRKEARPQELLDAALDLFVEKGYAATRSEEVAARAGVSKGTLYLYYGSKESLLQGVIRTYCADHIADGIAVVNSYEGPTADLIPLLYRTWWQRLGETRASGILKLVMSEVRNFPDLASFYLREVSEPAHRLIELVLERGIARGEFRDVDIGDLSLALAAPVLFLALDQHGLGACVPGRHDPRAVIEAQIDLVQHGLRKPAATAPVARTARGRAASPDNVARKRRPTTAR